MFRHPSWAVGSYSSGPPAANTIGTKSTGGFHQRHGSTCSWYLYPLLYEYVEALEDFVAVREALGGLVASLKIGRLTVVFKWTQF